MKEKEIREVRRLARIKRRNNVKEFIREYKRTHVCELCGEEHAACLEFHHKEPGVKDLSISDMIKYSSMKKVKEEIAKCAIVCANCHRKTHFVTGDWSDDRGPLV